MALAVINLMFIDSQPPSKQYSDLLTVDAATALALPLCRNTAPMTILHSEEGFFVFFFDGAVCPQKPHGFLGTGEEWERE